MEKFIRLNKNGKPDKRAFNPGNKRQLLDKTCARCSQLFRPRTSNQIFCKNKCRLEALHEKTTGVPKSVYWTKQDDKIIADMYPNMFITFSDIVSKLSSPKTWRQIKKRASKLGIRKDPESIRLWRQSRTGNKNPFYGKQHSDKTKKLLSESLTESSAFHRLNKDPEFQKKRRSRWLAGSVKDSPNKQERQLDEIIQAICPGCYKFVGDGSFIIDGLNPDWISIKKGVKKVIEFFGRAFHHTKHSMWKIQPRQTAKGRREALKKLGYSLLIIWDNELEEEPKIVARKIAKFNNE